MNAEKNFGTEQQHEQAPRGARFADDQPTMEGAEGLAPTITTHTDYTTATDTEKGSSSSAYANSIAGVDLRADRQRVEKKLLFKLGALALGTESRAARGGRARIDG